MTGTSGFAQRFSAGAFWNAVRFLGRRMIQTLAFFVFAYFMTPATFGVAAMATSLGFLGQMVVERGVIDWLVQRESHDQASLSTTFWIVLGLGVIMTLVTAAIGLAVVTVSDNFNDPSLFLAAGSIALLSSFSRVHEGLLHRDFSFRHLAALQLVASLAAFGISMALILAGQGPWAVILFVLSEAVILGLALWLTSAWRPGWQFDITEACELLRFSSTVILGSALLASHLRIAEIVLGLILGPAAAGFFRLGAQVNGVLTQALQAPVSNMLLPAFARLKDKTQIANYLTDISAVSAYVVWPAFMLAAAGVPHLFILTMGQEWKPAGITAQWICLAIFGLLLLPFVSRVLIATGRPFEATRAAFVIFITSLTLANLGAFVCGLTGASMGIAASTFVLVPYTLWLMRRHFEIALMEILPALVVPALASLSVFALSSTLLNGPATWSALVLSLIAGLTLYLALASIGAFVFDRARLTRMVHFAKSRR